MRMLNHVGDLINLATNLENEHLELRRRMFTEWIRPHVVQRDILRQERVRANEPLLQNVSQQPELMLLHLLKLHLLHHLLVGDLLRLGCSLHLFPLVSHQVWRSERRVLLTLMVLVDGFWLVLMVWLLLPMLVILDGGVIERRLDFLRHVTRPGGAPVLKHPEKHLFVLKEVLWRWIRRKILFERHRRTQPCSHRALPTEAPRRRYWGVRPD